MTHDDAVNSARALNGPGIHCEHHRVAAPERHDRSPALHPGPLLGQDELTSDEIVAGLGQQHRYLERKDVFPVEVLMEAVKVARPVAKQERRGAGLAGCVATAQEVDMIHRKPHSEPHSIIPTVGDRGEPDVKSGAQRRQEVRQRVSEIPIFTPAEPMAGHDDARAE